MYLETTQKHELTLASLVRDLETFLNQKEGKQTS